MASRVNVVKNVAEPQTNRRGLLSFDDELTKDYNIESIINSLCSYILLFLDLKQLLPFIT